MKVFWINETIEITSTKYAENLFNNRVISDRFLTKLEELKDIRDFDSAIANEEIKPLRDAMEQRKSYRN